MRKLLANVFGSLAKQGPRPARPSAVARTRPDVELLERRDTPTISWNPTAGLITVHGTSAADTATVRVDNKGTSSTLDDKVIVQVSDGWSGEFCLPVVKKIVFNGGAGNDLFRNETAIDSEAHGGAGDDTLIGGSGRDFLYGDADNDYLSGGDDFKADALYGGTGADTFAAEWVKFFNSNYNLDAAKDFDAAQGDHVARERFPFFPLDVL